jgi:hypothetical protein
MRAGEKKVLIWLALVLLLWRLFEVARVEEAFLQFMTVGALPGTDKTLSPDQVLILVAALFSVSLLLIFRKELVRSVRIRATAAQRHNLPETTQEATDPEPIIVRKRQSKGIRIPMPRLQTQDKRLPELYIPSVMPAIWRVMDWEMKQLTRLYRLLAKTYQRLKTIVVKGGKIIGIYSIAFWRWLEPQLRAFDKWLEKKAHKNRVSSDLIEIIDDCWRTVRFYVRKWTN